MLVDASQWHDPRDDNATFGSDPWLQDGLSTGSNDVRNIRVRVLFDVLFEFDSDITQV